VLNAGGPVGMGGLGEREDEVDSKEGEEAHGCLCEEGPGLG